MPTAPDEPAPPAQPVTASRRRTPGLRTMLAAFFVAITAAPLAVGLWLITAQVEPRLADLAAAELDAAAQRVADAIAERQARVGDLTADLGDLLVADDQAEALGAGDADSLDQWLDARAAARVPERADTIMVVDPDGEVLATSGEPARTTDDDLSAAVARGASPPGGLLSRREVRADVDGQEQSLGWVAAFAVLDVGELADAAGADLAVLAGDEALASSEPVPGVRPEPGRAATWEHEGARLLTTTVASPAGDVLVWRPDPGGLDVGGLLALVAVPALLLAGVLGWFLARRMTVPVSRAAQTARAVAEGDLDQHVPTDEGPAEVRDLAVALNSMASELSLRLAQLEASRDALGASLERVGQTLASSLDLDRVLGVIAEAAADVLHADGAQIALHDREDQLTVRARHGTAGVPPGQPAPPAGTGITGRVASSGQALRVPPDTTQPTADEPVAPCQLAVPLTVRGRTEGVLTLLRDDPEQPFTDGEAGLLGSFASQASVALENVHRHVEAQEQAATDGLTGLANVRTLHAALRREVDAAERYGRPLSVLMIDLDRFKRINDDWGHETGDRVLTEVSMRLRGFSRTADLVARAGGEEFVLLLPETPAAGATTVADRIRGAVAASPVVTAEGTVLEGITCSIGVAERLPAEDGDSLLRRADAAQYEAKRSGRDRVVVASETAERNTPSG